MEDLYKAYKDKAQFFLVYIREAHPVREAPPGRPGAPKRPVRGRPGPAITQHKTLDERVIAATQCIGDLKISLPTLIDDMQGTFQRTYGGFPAGTVVIDLDGKVVFSSCGPGGCQPANAVKHLDRLLAGQRQKHPTTQPAAKTPEKGEQNAKDASASRTAAGKAAAE